MKLQCPFCGCGLALECYEQVWQPEGDRWNLTYYCEGCGREFDKPENNLIPKPHGRAQREPREKGERNVPGRTKIDMTCEFCQNRGGEWIQDTVLRKRTFIFKLCPHCQ